MMGDAIAAGAGTSVHFVLTMKNLEGARAEVICDGEATRLLNDSAVKANSETTEFDYKSDGKRHWVRVNVRGADGKLLVLGNPIYFNF
jgi:hypothetical protein